MDSELWGAWGVFMTVYAPPLAGLLAFCLIGLAAWQKLPMLLRIIFGTVGGVVLLLAAWIWLVRPALLHAKYR